MAPQSKSSVRGDVRFECGSEMAKLFSEGYYKMRTKSYIKIQNPNFSF